MDALLKLLIALLRFVWPFANARTREVVGTVLGVLAALVAALSWIIPADPLPPVPDVPPPALDAPGEPDVPDVPAVETEAAPLTALRYVVGLLPLGCSAPQNVAAYHANVTGMGEAAIRVLSTTVRGTVCATMDLGDRTLTALTWPPIPRWYIRLTAQQFPPLEYGDASLAPYCRNIADRCVCDRDLTTGALLRCLCDTVGRVDANAPPAVSVPPAPSVPSP